jgi:hypothetical protein
MKNITLIKLETLDDALHPNKEKHIKKGIMWDYSRPKVGVGFDVLESKMYARFTTSPVTEIISDDESGIVFKTLNSLYKIVYE